MTKKKALKAAINVKVVASMKGDIGFPPDVMSDDWMVLVLAGQVEPKM